MTIVRSWRAGVLTATTGIAWASVSPRRRASVDCRVVMPRNTTAAATVAAAAATMRNQRVDTAGAAKTGGMRLPPGRGRDFPAAPAAGQEAEKPREPKQRFHRWQ